LSKISKDGNIRITDFKTNYRIIVAKPAWYRHKSRYMDQWNRRENPEISPHIYSQWILEKTDKKKIPEKGQLLNAWQNGYPHAEN
jgi:hypothetical protein